MSEDAFVEAVTQGQSVAPLYFAFTADSNRRVHELLDDHDVPPMLDASTSSSGAWRDGAVVIDGRSRGVVRVGAHPRLGQRRPRRSLRRVRRRRRPGRASRIVVVADDERRAAEAKVRLARIGFDDVRGAVVDVEHVLAARPDLAERADPSGRRRPRRVAATRSPACSSSTSATPVSRKAG